MHTYEIQFIVPKAVSSVCCVSHHGVAVSTMATTNHHGDFGDGGARYC